MVHQELFIEHQPQPLQELFIERQALAAKIGEAALILSNASADYNGLIANMIQLNERIREEEMHQ